MEPRPDILLTVEQAMKIRTVWEEVCSTHWGRPYEEVKKALTESADRWEVPIHSDFAAKAALEISCYSWE